MVVMRTLTIAAPVITAAVDAGVSEVAAGARDLGIDPQLIVNPYTWNHILCNDDTWCPNGYQCGWKITRQDSLAYDRSDYYWLTCTSAADPRRMTTTTDAPYTPDERRSLTRTSFGQDDTPFLKLKQYEWKDLAPDWAHAPKEAPDDGNYLAMCGETGYFCGVVPWKLHGTGKAVAANWECNNPLTDCPAPPTKKGTWSSHWWQKACKDNQNPNDCVYECAAVDGFTSDHKHCKLRIGKKKSKADDGPVVPDERVLVV